VAERKRDQWRKNFAHRLTRAVEEIFGSKYSAQSAGSNGVYRWTSGTRPTIDKLYLFASETGVSLDYLFFGREPMFSTEQIRAAANPIGEWDAETRALLRRLLRAHIRAIALDAIDSRPSERHAIAADFDTFREVTAQRIAQDAVGWLERREKAARDAVDREIDREVARLWKRELHGN
jgi:hypothetical protein